MIAARVSVRTRNSVIGLKDCRIKELQDFLGALLVEKQMRTAELRDLLLRHRRLVQNIIELHRLLISKPGKEFSPTMRVKNLEDVLDNLRVGVMALLHDSESSRKEIRLLRQLLAKE